MDASGEEWLQTGCRNNVLQVFLIQSGVNTTKVEPAVAHGYVIVRATDGQLSFHSELLRPLSENKDKSL